MKLLFALAYAAAVLHAFTHFDPDEAAVRAAVLAVAYFLIYQLVNTAVKAIARRRQNGR